MVDSKVIDFYKNNHGANLVERDNFPEEIKIFLKDEKEMISDLQKKNNYDSLLEVGCMDARMFEFAVKLKMNYVGIDVVEDFINKGRKKIENNKNKHNSYHISVCSARDLSGIKDILSHNSTLALFPFNSFGNMEDVQEIITEIRKFDLDLLISSYQIDEKSTLIRKKYYEMSGFKNLQVLKKRDFIEFTSCEGLKTRAYSPQYILKILLKNNYDIVAAEKFGHLGMAYFGGLK